ncbi:hypothetical protein DXG03_008925 [Asterophora parasitica]|uniref:DRBM domain-containing protein n=1 Tax=Asterophora parasitica TaxID=117018 RepID=A0A9P7GI93_9AGAR|nr:hypothetical protein DXG03_008925 [Asterophora parasitica]
MARSFANSVVADSINDVWDTNTSNGDMNYTTPGASLATLLKRNRPPSPPAQIPPLPKVTNPDLILQVYTHISLRRSTGRPEDYGDNERLIQLGRVALDAAATHALFHKRPMLRTLEIRFQREQALSDSNLNRWVTAYNMRQKIRCHPDVFASLHAPKETQSLFCAYVGGVYTELGMETVQEWISQLLLGQTEGSPVFPPPVAHQQIGQEYVYPKAPQPMDAPPSKKARIDHPPPYQSGIFFASQPPPSPPHKQRQTPPHFGSHTAAMVPPPPPPGPLPNPLAPAQPGLPFLPLFNQTAMQRGVKVDYVASFSGPPHAGRWDIRCIVNGIEKGVGMGASKQIAKEEAARHAYYAMGWT